MNSLAHYLEALADPMAHTPTLRAEAAFVLKALGADAFGRVLCVPVRNETPDALMRLLASVPASEQGPVLTVLVLAGQSGDVLSLQKSQAQLDQWLGETLERLGQPTDLRRFYAAQSGAVWVVDRYGPGRRFPMGEAVASSRKLAADLALRVWYEGLIAGDWLSFLDANMIVPHDFFAQTKGFGPDTVALAHEAQTIGGEEPASSALTVRMESYAQAGGWPKRDTNDLKVLSAELETLGRVARAEGEALVKVGTHTARSQGATPQKRSALPR